MAVDYFHTLNYDQSKCLVEHYNVKYLILHYCF